MPGGPKPPPWYFFAANHPPEIFRDEISWGMAICCQVKISCCQLFFVCVFRCVNDWLRYRHACRWARVVKIPCNCEKENIELAGHLYVTLLNEKNSGGVLDQRAGHDRPPCERSC